MKFKSKPTVIEAEQFTDPDRPPKGVEWCHTDLSGKRLGVKTINGHYVPVNLGDWIITEPDGVHHYPCDPKVFEERYSPLEEPKTKRPDQSNLARFQIFLAVIQGVGSLCGDDGAANLVKRADDLWAAYNGEESVTVDEQRVKELEEELATARHDLQYLAKGVDEAIEILDRLFPLSDGKTLDRENWIYALRALEKGQRIRGHQEFLENASKFSERIAELPNCIWWISGTSTKFQVSIHAEGLVANNPAPWLVSSGDTPIMALRRAIEHASEFVGNIKASESFQKYERELEEQRAANLKAGRDFLGLKDEVTENTPSES